MYFKNGSFLQLFVFRNGQILARSEFNYIIWTRTSIWVVFRGFRFDPTCTLLNLLSLSRIAYVCMYASAITMSHRCLRYGGTRVLQRVSEPRHSKAITIMSYTRYCSQLHRHSTRFRIIFYEDVHACCETFAHKRFERKLASRWKRAGTPPFLIKQNSTAEKF